MRSLSFLVYLLVLSLSIPQPVLAAEKHIKLLDHPALKSAVLKRLNGNTSSVTERDRRIAAEIMRSDRAQRRQPTNATLQSRSPRIPEVNQGTAMALPSDRRMNPAFRATINGQPVPATTNSRTTGHSGPALFINDGWKQPQLPDRPAISFDRLAKKKPTRTPVPPRNTVQPKTGVFQKPVQQKNQHSSPGAGGITEGANTKPHALRYSCCDDVEVRVQPSLTGGLVGTIPRSEIVWVLDIVGTGTPSGIGNCGSAPASCGTIWAQAYVPRQNLSGYVQLNALFVRPIKPKAGSLTFEVGYGKLAQYLKSGIQNEVIHPAGCGDPSNIVTAKGSDYSYRDSFFTPLTLKRNTCQDIMDTPCTYTLHSCKDMDDSNPAFKDCRYSTESECALPDLPIRHSSSDLNVCVKSCPIGGAVCADCRIWYHNTGQDKTGWMTGTEMMDRCLAQIVAEGTDPCLGGGIPVPSGDDAPPQGDPSSDPHPNPTPEPSLPAPQQAPDGLKARPSVQQATSTCVDTCKALTQSELSSECGRYIGPNDERKFGDPADYECGELPIGQTHYHYWQNTDTGAMTGGPDQNWKVLTEFNLPGDKPVFVKLGRFNKQKSFEFEQADLTTFDNRKVSAPSSLEVKDVWMSFHPMVSTVKINNKEVEKDMLFVDACLHLPGNKIDGGSATYQSTDQLFPLVRKIDLGGADFSQMLVCGVSRVYLDDNYNPQVDLIDIYRLDADVTDIHGVDIDYGPGAIAAVFVPFVGLVLLNAMLQIQLTLNDINNGDLGVDLANYAVDTYSAKVIDKILPKIQSAIATAMKNAQQNPRDKLEKVCEDLDPNVNQSHPFYYFYRFLRWHCDGFTKSHTLRPFRANPASEEHGCYWYNAYMTPDDAGLDRWWAKYQGQQWAFPLWPDSGCRIGATMESTLDQDIWPTLTCATMTFNAWFNNGPQPPGTSLKEMVSANCRDYGLQALEAYYGNGQDLIDLFQTVHTPKKPDQMKD